MSIFKVLSGGIIEGIGKVADELITSDEERAEKENEKLKTSLKYKLENNILDKKIMLGQIETNKAEASHSSIFIAGWRPAIGWIGAIALGYQFVLYPFLTWIWTFLQARQIIPNEIACPPILDIGALWTIITGMLGIGAMRSFDKVKNKDTKKI